MRRTQGSRSGEEEGRPKSGALRSRRRWRARRRRRSAEETAIGALTAGGEASPQTKQEAADLIASIEKRLNALSAQKAEEQKAQVSKVKNFLEGCAGRVEVRRCGGGEDAGDEGEVVAG